VHTLSHQVEDAIHLDAFSVADEHARRAPVAQLAEDIQHLDVRKAAERAEVPDHRCAPMLGLVQSLPLQALGRRSVEQVHRGHHRFSLELRWHAPLLEQGAGGCHHSLVPMLDHAALLRRVRHEVVALDPLIRAVGGELRGGDLATIVNAQHLKFEASLLLRHSLNMLDGVRGCRLHHKDDPHEPRCIVHHQQEVAPASRCCWRDGAAVIAVDELELLLCAVHSLTGKGPPLELGHHACVAQLLDVVNLRHPAHHLLTPKLPEHLEVEMPESFVPSPSLIVSTSGEAEGPDHRHVKHVQPVVPAVDLGEKTAAAVPDPEHPSVNLHP
jgi:hypothetical protein